MKTQGTLSQNGIPADISWSQAPRIVASGVCMGTADLVPGVSGGTMAVALGIYRQLLAAVSSVGVPALRQLLRGNLREAAGLVHLRFITALGLGMGLAVVIMGKVLGLHELVSTSPKLVYSVFFGLVLASTVLLLRKVGSWSPVQAASLVVGAGLGFLIVTLVPTHTPETPLFVFLSGVVAICAMILPGISGSFILLVLGKYEYIISSILKADVGVALPFAIGCALGLAAFARVLGRALDRFHDPVLAGLTGLLLGSLFRIWPYQHLEKAMIRGKLRVVEARAYWPESVEGSVIGLMLLGLLAVFVVEWLARRSVKVSSETSVVPASNTP